jgi:polyferredoxin
VQVCPTGIDIRQGLQLECIGCAACIDACDEVMTRVHRPRGLIRYDSLNGLAGKRTRWLRPRIIVYSLLLVAGATVAGFSVSRFQPAGMSLVRMTGASYFVDETYVRNQFFVRVTNQQPAPARFTVRMVPVADAPVGWIQRGWEEPVEVPADADERRPLVLLVPRAAYAGRFAFRVEVTVAPGGLVLRRDAEFVGPDPRLFQTHAQPAP